MTSGNTQRNLWDAPKQPAIAPDDVEDSLAVLYGHVGRENAVRVAIGRQGAVGFFGDDVMQACRIELTGNVERVRVLGRALLKGLQTPEPSAGEGYAPTSTRRIPGPLQRIVWVNPTGKPRANIEVTTGIGVIVKTDPEKPRGDVERSHAMLYGHIDDEGVGRISLGREGATGASGDDVKSACRLKLTGDAERVRTLGLALLAITASDDEVEP